MLRRIGGSFTISSHVDNCLTRVSSTQSPPSLRVSSNHPATFSSYAKQQSNNAPLGDRSNLNLRHNRKEDSCISGSLRIGLLGLPTLQPGQHYDRQSFLAYSKQSGLDRNSTVYRGTLYEYNVLHALEKFGFDLVRVGGRGDFGVDLVGYWHLSNRSDFQHLSSNDSDDEHTARHEDITEASPRTIRVIVQCKRVTSKGKISPNMVRELEGAFRGAPVGWRGDDVIGFLVGPQPATKGVVQALRRSDKAVGWILLEEISNEAAALMPQSEDESGTNMNDCQGVESSTVVKQMLWNNKARQAGLEGLDVVKKHDDTGTEAVMLMYKGRPL